ncbi:MAG TPA: integrase arm-type DNA-binding domain-containing protein [Vicinamibacterales bacterium]
MPTLKLTSRALDTLPLPSGGRVEYFDESLPGFAVRVFPSGRRVFTLLYRMKGGRVKKKERVDIGTCPPLTLAQARDLATKLKAEIQLGKDPRRERVPARPADATVLAADGLTVKQLCAAYLVHPSGGGKLRAASTLPHYRRLIDAEIVPAFGDRRAAAVTRAEVREWSERLADEKPVVANRAFAVMRRSYEWALGRDLVQSSPFVGIHKPAAEVPRDRVLSDDEIRAVFDALRHERPIIAALWELLFYTAVRPGTALAARWSHIDLPRKVWEVPVTKKARGSAEGTGKPFIVPLSPQAIAVLQLLQPFSAHSDYVFPGERPRRAIADAERNLFNPQKSIQRMREKTEIGDLQMRDIRRTVATGLGKLKVPPVTISRILDHTIQGIGQVTHVYAKYDFFEEKREALDLWGRYLATLLNASSAPLDGRLTPRQPRRDGSETREAALAGRQSRLFGPGNA